MAIKINADTLRPLGRITMPKGSYLPQKFDNPSTAAAGTLGTVSGGSTPPYNPFSPENFWGNAINPKLINPSGAPVNPWGWGAINPRLLNPSGAPFNNMPNINPYLINPSGNGQPLKLDFSTQKFVSPFSPTSHNTLVGKNISNDSNQITMKQIQSMFGGMTPDEITQTMAEKGYTRTYQPGVGEVFIRTEQAQPQQQYSAPIDERGRPAWVDPTTLAQGESVTTSSGFTYVGGTPYTNPAGETVAQYAMTVPGVKDDPKGMYKWKSFTKQDNSGNWVKIYVQALRGKFTKAGQKRIEARREEQAKQDAAVVGMTPISPTAVGQLVNLRADYG